MDFFFLLLGIVFLIGPILGIVAFFQGRGLRAELRRHQGELEALRALLAANPPPAPEATAPPQAEPPQAEPPVQPDVEPEPEPEPLPEPVILAPPVDFETRLAQRWMVWAGGVVLLGAVVLFFLYSIDQGWLSPTIRVILGLLAGAGLIVAGEAARRRSDRDGAPGEAPRPVNFVPAALTGAGLFALFASLFVAYAVLSLLPGPIAFALLGAVGFFGLALSLRHGWLVAALGLIAAYGTPLAIHATSPMSSPPFFAYLFVLNAAVAWLCSGRNWPWIARAGWLGGFGWALVILLDGGLTQGDRVVMGLYLVATAVLGVLFPAGGTLPLPRLVRLSRPEAPDLPLDAFVAGGLLLLLGPGTEWTVASNVALWLFGLFGLLCGARFPAGRWTAVAAAGSGLLATLLWPDPLAPMRGAHWMEFARTDTLAATSLWFTGLFGFGGFVLARRSGSGFWAGLSVATAFAALTIVYLRYTIALIPVIEDPDAVLGRQSWALFSHDPPWTFAFLALAMLFLGAATVLSRQGAGRAPIAAYAAGVTGATAMALAIAFDGPWLTLALAAEGTALGWIWSRTRVEALRPIAGLVALLVLSSMIFGLADLGDPLSAQLTLSWALRGLVLPTLLLWVALRLFGLDRAETRVSQIVLGLFLGLTALTGALTLSAVIEASGIRWLIDWKLAALGLWCLGLSLRVPRSSVAVGAPLLVLGIFLGVFIEGFANNPFFSERALGGWPVVNALGLVYLAPALMLLWQGARGDGILPAQALAWSGGGLLLLYLSFETLRTVDGTEVLRIETVTEPALYAVSIVWIATAFALLAFGLRSPGSERMAALATPERRKALRLTALGLLTAAACKLFILDMAGLSGLWRIASFLGLGASLIGVGEIYRRVMRPGS